MTTQDDSGTHATLADSGDTSDHQELSQGSNLGRYVIIEPIGSGGMGTVYRAYDPQLNRGVALKILSVKHADIQAAERAKARLIREAQALAQLSHPNVVAVHDAGTFEDDVFIAMELVEGKTLDEWMRQEKRSVKKILRVMIAAGQGLSAAHKAGLIHRDFKPGNVVVGDDGRVRVLDFGLARAADQQESVEEGSAAPEPVLGKEDYSPQGSEDSLAWKEISSDSSPNLLQSPLTHDGGVLGTPLYMAPEQHLGLKTDERTDQFGFCVVLYEVLYGKRPFAARSMEKLKNKVIRHQLSNPSTDAEVPTWLWKIIRKGLSVKPEDRYATIDSLLEEIDKDPEEIHRQKRLVRRRKLLVVLLILMTISLPVGVWYGLRYRTVQLCKDAEGEFDGVWDNKTKDSVQTAFLGTEKSFALGTWERVEKTIDHYLAEWTRMRSEVCEAGLIRGTQSEELFDLRMSCLQKRVRELNALVAIFTRADAGVVQKAIQASTSLVSIGICADEEALRAPYFPPKTKQDIVKVTEIRDKLTEVEALEKTGKYRQGLELANKLKQQALAVEYPPVQAEVLFRLGKLLNNNGDYKTAETTLYDAARAAGKSRDSRLAAEVATFLVSVVGYAQGRPDDGLLISQYADFVIELGGGEEAQRSQFHNNLGTVFMNARDYPKALEQFGSALEIQQKIFGSEHPIVASAHNNLGAVCHRLADFDSALEYFRRAYVARKKVFGPEHPEVAGSLNNMGLVFFRQGTYDKALRCYREALSIKEKTLGAEHPGVAKTLNNLGLVFHALGDDDKALAYYRRSLAIKEKAHGPEHLLVAESLENMGLVFCELGQVGKALAFYRRSAAIKEKTLGPEHPDVAILLNGIGIVFLAQNRLQHAIKPLERLAAICEKKSCEPATHGQGLFGLARALVATNGDKVRAIKLATRARNFYEKTPKKFKEELEELNTWLQQHGAEKLAKKVAK